MAFWKWRSSSRRDDSFTAAPRRDEARPLVLFTRDGRVSGVVSTHGRRVTDFLNESDTIVVTRSAVEVPAYAGAGASDLPVGVHARREGDTAVETDDVLVVIPPSHQSARQMQVHRRQRRVELQIGPWLVEGHAHVTPGVPLDAYVARLTNQFIPLTNVLIQGPEVDGLEQPMETAIVNVRAIVALQALS